MDIVLIAVVSFGAALLTFFSGFGLGTILLPAFAFFFPVEIAISMTAIVHLVNNLFKIIMVKNYIDKNVAIRFAIPASIFAFIGAYVLSRITATKVLYTLLMFNKSFDITLLKLIIGILMLLFAVIELSKKLQQITFSKKYLPLGGSLSGFFSGLSGHQGALRSMFLIKSGLSKEAFIATGIAAAVLIDIARLSIYGVSFFTKNENLLAVNNATQLIVIACFSAFLGSFFGKKILKES